MDAAEHAIGRNTNESEPREEAASPTSPTADLPTVAHADLDHKPEAASPVNPLRSSEEAEQSHSDMSIVEDTFDYEGPAEPLCSESTQPRSEHLQITSPTLTPLVRPTIVLTSEEPAGPNATTLLTSDDIDELTQLDSSPTIFENDSENDAPTARTYVWMRIETEPLPKTEEPDELLAIWDCD